MTTLGWSAITLATALSTELNSLANGAFCTASPTIDNTVSPRYQYIAVELNLASLSPTAGAYVDVWIKYAPDGTNFSDHAKALQLGGRLMTIPLDTTASTPQRLPAQIAPILPLKFMLVLRNLAGAAL